MHASAEDGRGWAASGDQELRWETVLDVYERSVDATVHLDIVDEVGGAASIVTTTEHPFWRYGAGWLPAKDLRSSDRVWSAERGWLRIVRTALRYVQEPVYNLRVDSSHTYFVSDLAVWVHNAKCPVPNGDGASPAPAAGVETPHYQGPRAAPETSAPNSIWETQYSNGNRRVTYFDENGAPFSREDYGQQARHIIDVDGQRVNLKNTPHEHQTRMVDGPKGQYPKNQVRTMDQNGYPTSGWVNEK